MTWWIAIIGCLGLLFGMRWLLAVLRLESLRSSRRRGGARGHYLGRGDRRVLDRVFFTVCAAGALGLVIFRWHWAPWISVALVGPTVVLAGMALEKKRAASLEQEAMAVLEALRGLLRSGALSPPAALARIGGIGKGRGASRLRSRLETLDRGDSFETALRRFARKLGGTATASTFQAIASASHAGLPILPILDQVLPELRREKLAEEKLAAVRARAVAQALVASAIPWGLSSLMAASMAEAPAANSVVAATRAFAVLLEVLGLAMAWRMTCFR